MTDDIRNILTSARAESAEDWHETAQKHVGINQHWYHYDTFFYIIIDINEAMQLAIKKPTFLSVGQKVCQKGERGERTVTTYFQI